MVRARKTNTAKGSKAIGAAPGPTAISAISAISSTLTTPLSSAYPSAYASEAEYDGNDEVAKLQAGVDSLSLSPNLPKPKRKKQQPFRFLDLPSELRVKVYEYHFANTGVVLDLDPDNYKRIHQKLAILRSCRTIYGEASYFFYSTHPARIFPTHPGRFFKTKKPLLARMKPGQRASMTSLELRLGPGWSKPPRGWVVNEALGLSDCVNVAKLTVFIECDPGNDIFKGFRQPDNFYERFSKSLLTDVLDEMPWVARIEFDAWPSVKKSGALMRGLMDLTTSRGLKITWGKERGWTDAEEVEPKPALNLNDPLPFISQGNPGIMVVV
ncbi:Exosome non-catalytic core component [Hypoxylon texense]